MIRIAIDCEEWKDIAGFPKNQVSILGRVRSNGRLRSTRVRPGGYEIVKLFIGKKEFDRSVHRLVLEAFRGPCPENHEASHLDGNRLNNELKNLQWMTRKQNHALKKVHGTDFSGERNPWAKLTWAAVKEIRSMCPKRWLRATDAFPFMEKYNVCLATVRAVAYGKVWREC